MKIWAFTTVRDEEDIIESFVRYNMNVFDGIVISDNCSNDNTLTILKQLKKEGYNIDILIDQNTVFDQTVRRNELLNYTINKYKPDFIFPIDADEFVCSYDGENPRNTLKKVDKNYLYKYRMENYILTENDNDDLFIPKKIVSRRKEKEEQKCNYKCFISKNIYSKGIFLEMGSHSARCQSGQGLPENINRDLYIAHFPVRSKEQLMNKVIIGRLNHSSFHDRSEGFGFHQYEILDEIIEKGSISKKTLLKFSKYYSVVDKKIPITYTNNPISLSFCKNINIKYYKGLNKKLILSNTIKVSEGIINRLRREKQEIEIVNQKIISEKERERDYYKEELSKVLNSKTWQLKEKILKLLGKKRGKYRK